MSFLLFQPQQPQQPMGYGAQAAAYGQPVGYGSQPSFNQPGFQGQPQQNYPNHPVPGSNQPNQGVSYLVYVSI